MADPEKFSKALGDSLYQLFSEPKRHPVIRTQNDEERAGVLRDWVLRRDNFRCVICGKGGLLEVDHIVPWSAGGSDDVDNLRTLCRRCNQERSNFAVPIDGCRRLPNATECVYCQPCLITDYEHPQVAPVYCLVCNRKAPGVAS